MAEDPQPMTLQQRIASLNAAHLGRMPNEPPLPTNRPVPQMPDRRPPVKQKSFNLPNENTISASVQPRRANLPQGPPPLPVRKKPPPLPARKSSQEIETVAGGCVATRTNLEEQRPRVKAPAWKECSLPPLPAKAEFKTRTKSITDNSELVRRKSSTSSLASTGTAVSNTLRYNPPPPLPSRKSSSDSAQHAVPRKVPPLPTTEALEKARKASFTSSVNAVDQTEAIQPSPMCRPSDLQAERFSQSMSSLSLTEPPPIPKASRPDMAAIQANKPKLNGNAHPTPQPPSSVCMVCRDFSGPDNHAKLFPRQTVSSLPALAQQLTAPFTSDTDKARAIFTWLHLNIDYNVKDFFGGCVKSSTPQSTLQTGLAVCEGYAALFTNLAAHAGLQSRVLSGHGKGYGYQALAPGSPVPSFSAGHAWNVVRIDNGEWKLIDACWGAGYCNNSSEGYVRRFAAERFTQSNEEFGIDHFPQDKDGFYLPGGRVISWEDYILFNPEPPTLFGNATSDYDIGKQTVLPPTRKINIHQSNIIRFQFGLFCPHWTLHHHSRKGPPPVFFIAAGGVDGRNKHYVPLHHVRENSSGGGGGDLWYIDIPARELGASGETLTLFAVTKFGDKHDARGLSIDEFKAGIGLKSMSFTGIAAWELK